jgi:hypothetical protein
VKKEMKIKAKSSVIEQTQLKLIRDLIGDVYHELNSRKTDKPLHKDLLGMLGWLSKGFESENIQVFIDIEKCYEEAGVYAVNDEIDAFVQSDC